MGASAGGLEAFTELLKHLPTDTGMAFVLVQHLDPAHKSLLRDLLASATSLPVTEAQDGMLVQPNVVYLIPPNADLSIRGRVLRLQPLPRPRTLRRSVDHFFTSLAEVQGPQAMGVILSGTGLDGTQGLEAIKAAGGITFAQNETAASDGMPQSAIAAGCVDFILSAADIARELGAIAKTLNLASPSGGRKPVPDPHEEQERDRILAYVQESTGLDFKAYKTGTIGRRIARRMVVNKRHNLAEYRKYLSAHPAEAEALVQDLLISVTSFFRDRAAFDYLKNKVLPRIFKQPAPDKTVRVWVVGCSTGQEAYSLGMVLLEFAQEHRFNVPIQVFATDVNEQSLARARAGSYTEAEMQPVSLERRARFFEPATGGGWRVNKSLRAMCVFARHDIIANPPFSQMDLLSCRNLLIYLQPELQKMLLPLFHYSLKPGGFLWLGPSESIDGFGNLFTTAQERHKLYTKKSGTSHTPFVFTRPGQRREVAVARAPEAARPGPEPDAGREVERLLLARYAPAGVVVNDELEVLQFRGETGAYLRPAPGKPDVHLLKMLRDGLLVPVRGAIQESRKLRTSVRKEGVRVKQNGGSRLVNLLVMPLKHSPGAGRTYLILFEPPSPAEGKGVVAKSRGRPGREPAAEPHKAESARNLRLEEELVATREYLQAMIEQQESTNEELQAANEEARSSNEELQSINEELGASKEEMQASNEELKTINDELQTRIRDEQEARAYADAIIETAPPLLVLDHGLRVLKANDSFYTHFEVTRQDTENRLIYDLGNRQWNIPRLRTLLEEILPANSFFKDFEVSHVFESLGPRTMLLSGRRVDSLQRIILAIHDITERKEAEDKLRLSEQRFQAIIRQAAVGIAETDLTGRFLLVNARYCEMAGLPEENLLQMSMQDITYPDDVPQTQRLFERAVRDGVGFVTEKRFLRPDRAVVWVRSEVVRLTDAQGRPHRILAVSYDITRRKAAEQELRESNERLQFMAESLPQKIITADEDGRVTYLNRQWAEFVGKPLEQAECWSRWEFVHPEDREETLQRWRDCLATGGTFQMEHRFRRADGQYRWHLSRALAMRDAGGKVRMWIGSCTDIDDQRLATEVMRQAQKQSANQAADLERLVAGRTAELQASNSELETFVYSIAHDLRAPLRSMQGFSQTLVEQYGPVLAQEGREFTRVISESAQYMDDLLGDLLAFSRLSHKPVTLTPVSLERAVQAVVRRCKAEIEKRAARVEIVPPLPDVLAQLAVLEQVLGNLLANALKFVAAGVQPQIRFWAEAGPEVVRLWVQDNGIGLPEENRERIFQVFQRMHTEGYAGTGIGLAIVKKGMERMHGRVGVESTPGQGSRFWIELARPPLPAASPVTPPPEKGKQPRHASKG